MKQSEVLIIGNSIAGCTTALTLAKQGILVCVVASSKDFSSKNPFKNDDKLLNIPNEVAAKQLRRKVEALHQGACSSRILDQIEKFGIKSSEELIFQELNIHLEREQPEENSDYETLINRDVNSKTIKETLYEELLSQLKTYSNVEILFNLTPIDLITLAQHSQKQNDLYKKPTCIGCYFIDNSTSSIIPILSKETILATNGVENTHLHSIEQSSSSWNCLAIAHRAGARLIHLDQSHWHPFTFYAPNEPLFPIPKQFCKENGELLTHQGTSFMQKYHENTQDVSFDQIAQSIYKEMHSSNSEHLWLDFSSKDLSTLRDSFPSIYEHSFKEGFDLSKDPLPIVPSFSHNSGGIYVDHTGETSIQRLRAVGEVSCTGLQKIEQLPGGKLFESLLWGTICGLDIGHDIKKFSYYLPNIINIEKKISKKTDSLLSHDSSMVEQIMWLYNGPVTSEAHLRRAFNLLQEINHEVETLYHKDEITLSLQMMRNKITTALLITQAKVATYHPPHSLKSQQKVLI